MTSTKLYSAVFPHPAQWEGVGETSMISRPYLVINAKEGVSRGGGKTLSPVEYYSRCWSSVEQWLPALQTPGIALLPSPPV